MKSNFLQSLLTDSSARAKFFAQYFSLFALIYHLAFITVFFINGVDVMVYINFVSVPLFIVMAGLSPVLKTYVPMYLISCIEVYVHQIMAIYVLGGNSAFHFFFIPFAILPLLIFKDKFVLAMILASIGGVVFIGFELTRDFFVQRVELAAGIFETIRAVNIFLAVAVILSSIFIFAYIAWFSEKHLEITVLKKSHEIFKKDRRVFELQKHTVNCLANLVESRDSETGEHIQRTSSYVEMIAREAMIKGVYPDEIDEAFIQKLKKAAPMHDIGKIVVSDSILKKRGKLSIDEYSDMKRHTVEGSKIVKEIIGISDDPDYLRIAEEVALSHHERWDGSGYPNHLKESEIPVSARIMAIADVFDALISERCYKTEIPVSEAFEIITRESGKHFDPVLVEVFIGLKPKILSFS